MMTDEYPPDGFTGVKLVETTQSCVSPLGALTMWWDQGVSVDHWWQTRPTDHQTNPRQNIRETKDKELLDHGCRNRLQLPFFCHLAMVYSTYCRVHLDLNSHCILPGSTRTESKTVVAPGVIGCSLGITLSRYHSPLIQTYWSLACDCSMDSTDCCSVVAMS